MTETAKVFWSGNSQAVRLPKEFRFPRGVTEVAVRREGVTLVLAPVERKAWPESFWRAFGGMSEGFARPEQAVQERPGLDPGADGGR
jgi:antitoxin VapB